MIEISSYYTVRIPWENGENCKVGSSLARRERVVEALVDALFKVAEL